MRAQHALIYWRATPAKKSLQTTQKPALALHTTHTQHTQIKSNAKHKMGYDDRDRDRDYDRRDDRRGRDDERRGGSGGGGGRGEEGRVSVLIRNLPIESR